MDQDLLVDQAQHPTDVGAGTRIGTLLQGTGKRILAPLALGNAAFVDERRTLFHSCLRMTHSRRQRQREERHDRVGRDAADRREQGGKLAGRHRDKRWPAGAAEQAADDVARRVR